MNLEDFAAKAGIILIEIDGSGISQGRTYTDKTTGQTKPLSDSQTAFIWQGSKYPVEVSIDIPSGKPPYRPGFYFIGGPLFGSGDYGRVTFKGTRELELVDVSLVLDSLGIEPPKAKAA